MSKFVIVILISIGSMGWLYNDYQAYKAEEIKKLKSVNDKGNYD